MPISAAYIVPHPPLIVPDVGKGQEALIQKTIDSYHAIAKQIAELKPQTIVLISPHSVSYADYFHIAPGNETTGDLTKFRGNASIKVTYDAAIVSEIARLADESDFPAGYLGEKEKTLDHASFIPLYFVNQYYNDYKLVRCSISGLPRAEHYKFGMLIKEALDTLDRNCVVIASGDLSHKLTEDGPYGFAPEGSELDKKLLEIMRSGNFFEFFWLDPVMCERGGECGLSPFVVMSGILDKIAVSADLMSYEGPFGVGYAVCSFKTIGDDQSRDFLEQYNNKKHSDIEAMRKEEDSYVRLARITLESYITTGDLPVLPNDLPQELLFNRAGVFVSIKKDGQLRGCIGTIEPTQQSIAAEIMNNAISSGTKDNRFWPVEAKELDSLVYSVDVLSEAFPVADKTTLDPKRYGVIVTLGARRGLLLPNLDGVDTVDEQIAIACKKAGISINEPYNLEAFEVVRHK